MLGLGLGSGLGLELWYISVRVSRVIFRQIRFRSGLVGLGSGLVGAY